MEIKNARELLGADKIIGVTAKTIEARRKQQKLPEQIILEAEQFWNKHESRCKTDGIRFVSGNL